MSAGGGIIVTVPSEFVNDADVALARAIRAAYNGSIDEEIEALQGCAQMLAEVLGLKFEYNNPEEES